MTSGIGYYPDLVGEMVDDHRQLLGAFGELVKAANAHDSVGFSSGLATFKSLLVGHLLKEAIKLYIYLRQQLRSDEGAYALITSYKSEMDGISRIAMAFVDAYSGKARHELDFPTVIGQLRELGVVLGDRIRREEAELYPLYHDRY